MPRHYPADLRRQTCERMLAGEAVKDLAIELGVAEVTLYKWRRQALIDAGRRPGVKSYEADPLAAARRRIKDLEAELKVVKAASALFEEGGGPKRKFQVVRGLNNLGYSERLACRVVGLDRSTYYDIKFRKPNDREIRRLLLADAIADIHARSQPAEMADPPRVRHRHGRLPRPLLQHPAPPQLTRLPHAQRVRSGILNHHPEGHSVLRSGPLNGVKPKWSG